MIRLTNAFTEESIWLSPDHITNVGRGKYGEKEATYVISVNDTNRNESPYFVTESPSEVARKVLEYKLAMIRYSTGYTEALQHHGDPQWIFENAELKLSYLAGLEDTNDG